MMRAVLADITTLSVDAIVNAANEALAAGGGVCGAIFHAAGPELVDACRSLGRCPTGSARATPGFNLPCRYVIHAVGPVWEGGDADEARLLASAYRASMEVAADLGCRSIAFPALSTGVFGYPLDEAMRVAVESVQAANLRLAEPLAVTFACFSQEALAACDGALSSV